MLGALLALAATVANTATPTPRTVQQLFDDATAASERGDEAAALAGYDEIERRLGTQARPSTLAIVRARRGVALSQMGRLDEAALALRFAQSNLSRTDASLKGDRYFVSEAIGRIEELGLDYTAAARAYHEAESNAPDAQTLRIVWAALARVTMFDDPTAALALANKALSVPSSDPANAKAADAQYRTLKARVLLNAKDYTGARRELDLAVSALGGLTLKVDMSDVVTRSDLAIAALLAGDRSGARKYLAFTGAGTMRDVLAPPAAAMDVPACGGSEGLTPDDIAVVELSIREDGSVGHAAPIYVSRSGPAALSFARAVSTWAWTPEQVARIPLFFRTAMRIELRCSTAQERPSILELLKPAAAAWRGVDRTPLPDERDALGAEEHAKAAREWLARAEAARAPAAAIAFFAIYDAYGAGGRGYSRRQSQRIADALGVAAMRQSIAVDPQARAAVLLVQADALIGMRAYSAALPSLEAIAGDAALGTHDPLKVGALLRLATIRAASGDLAAARTAYEQTGLTAQQCALVDAKPALLASNSNSSDFPREAMQWGFEGWVQTEFDVTSSGRTANARAIAAYPPFVFTHASVAVASGARYTQSYRPEGGLGCGGQRQKIRFGLPGFKG